MKRFAMMINPPPPIFYKLKDVPRLAQSVKQLKDIEARIWEWRQAISSISSRSGLSNENRSDPVFFTDVVTKVKELFEIKAIPKKSSSYIITNQVIEEKPIMHQQKSSPAIPTVKSLDDDLFYSLPSFLQALDHEITDLEGFTEMHNGLISLSLKRHTNLVCLNLDSLEKLGFGLNHPGISRFEEPSRVLEIESSQPQQRFDNVSSQNHQYHINQFQIPSKSNMHTSLNNYSVFFYVS
ncbi:hypothetical protein Bca52824_088456 [Brassica carinata]|uniref:Uncharacterized protein n=1 Tax=Brassica carinata TaxID=52824 RepID=A0A8X7PE40_BRACI|nr:hypothetical protein Bca52824_088456 [Brassica carinata]